MNWMSLYDRLPIVLQNALIAHHGRKLHRMRFGGAHPDQAREILRCEAIAEPEMRAYQVEKLRAILTEAADHLPYYRDRAGELRDLARRMHDPSEITALPILEKRTINADPGAFHSIRPRGKRMYGSTSGTTGRPVRTMKVPESYQRNWAFLVRCKEIHGVRIGMRRASFGHRPVVPIRQRKPPFWRFEPSENNVYFSVFHLSDEYLAHYVEKLIEWKPEEIVTYPSSLTVVADYMIRKGITLSGIRAVFTMSESLLGWQREKIAPAFGTKVVNFYGLAENVAWIYECPGCRLHVRPDYGYTELMSLEDAAPEREGGGEIREIVSTGFLNLAMPLLRYRTGDQVVLTAQDKEPCRCGVWFPTVTEVVGRTDDNLVTPDGRVQTHLTSVFKGMEGVRESQIEQVALDHLVVRIVRRDDYRPETGEEVTRRLHRIFGNETQVEIEFVEALQRTRAGKVRYQINSLPGDGAAGRAGAAGESSGGVDRPGTTDPSGAGDSSGGAHPSGSPERSRNVAGRAS